MFSKITLGSKVPLGGGGGGGAGATSFLEIGIFCSGVTLGGASDTFKKV